MRRLFQFEPDEVLLLFTVKTLRQKTLRRRPQSARQQPDHHRDGDDQATEHKDAEDERGQGVDADRGGRNQGNVSVVVDILQQVIELCRRGLDGTVMIGPNEVPAKMMAGILSIEFLVHAWDFAASTGGTVSAPDALPDYVLGLAKTIITPQGRSNVGFDDPVDVAADAGALDRLIAFTGRQPA